MLSFFLTTKCNLCCVYCYNAKERNSIEEKTLSLNVAKKGVDWYFEKNESRHIRFYGPGEPTQEFEIMKAITEYAKKHVNGGERVTVEIQTNGVFTETIRGWLLNNVNIIWMSFDGMKEIHNYNRPLNPKYNSFFDGKTSAEVLEDNVKWLIKNIGKNNLMVGARVTITNENVDKQLEMVDYFYELGIRYVWTDPVFQIVEKKPVCEKMIHKNTNNFNMDLYIENYLKAYHYANKKGMFWGSFLAVNFDGQSQFHCRACLPLSAPHLTPDGYISACDMVLLGSNPHHMDPFIVGKWNEKNNSFDIYEDKIRALNNRTSKNLSHCQNCSAQLYCGGYCLGECVNEAGRLDGRIPDRCNAIRKLFEEIGACENYPYMHP